MLGQQPVQNAAPNSDDVVRYFLLILSAVIRHHVYIYYINIAEFGQLIIRKIITIVATRCHIRLKAKMRPIRFRLQGSGDNPLQVKNLCMCSAKPRPSSPFFTPPLSSSLPPFPSTLFLCPNALSLPNPMFLFLYQYQLTTPICQDSIYKCYVAATFISKCLRGVLREKEM